MELRITSKKIWVCTKPVDFRKSIDGLSELIHSQFESLPTEGIYIFYNRQRDKLKLLAWHGNGFVLLYKRLEQGKFKLSNKRNEVSNIDETQLSWLLAGLDWESMASWKTLEYKGFY